MTHNVIVGLGFGDEGKGAAVDWLCATENVRAVIRYNGGAQAAHNVVQPDGRHHTFALFGSGTFHGVPTHLSEHVLVNPFNMYQEALALSALGLGDPFDITTISEDALLVTPYHRLANRVREDTRGDNRHGSTGQGIGEARFYGLKYPKIAPRIGDIGSRYALTRLLDQLRLFYEASLGDEFEVEQSPEQLVAEYQQMLEYMKIVPSSHAQKILDEGDCVFEGAQGVLLDESFGFHPHTTWTDTTANNARKLLAGREHRTIGLTRAYHTRHGHGPFPTENYETDVVDFPEPHNAAGKYQGDWRVGALDLSLLQYAVKAVGDVDTIMVSHMDRVAKSKYGVMATYGYTDYKHYFIPIEMEKLRVPVNRDEQHYLTEFLSTPGLRPEQYDLLENEDDVANAIEFATGVRPTMFASGPTSDDRQRVDVAVV